MQPGTEVVDHTTAGRTSTDGLGLLVVVTSSAGSQAATLARASAGPDESVIIISTVFPTADQRGFHVDGTSLAHLEHGWNQLVHGRSGARV